MDPLRKKLSGDSQFPFELVYKDTKQPQHELPDHFHDWYELVVVYRGKGRFFIHQTFYEMAPGDVFLIPGNTIHRAFPDDRTPVTSTAVFFHAGLAGRADPGDAYPPLRCFELARKRNRYRMEFGGESRLRLQTLVDGMQEELAARRPGVRQAVLLRLQLLLLELNRAALAAAADDAGDAAAGAGPGWMQDILRHIDAEPAADLGLAALCRRASVTPSHFSRVFKRLTGFGVTDYVTAKRIVAAKDQLLHTEKTIPEIAALCGFGNLSYFHRQFKRLTGLTPRGYRQRELGMGASWT